MKNKTIELISKETFSKINTGENSGGCKNKQTRKKINDKLGFLLGMSRWGEEFNKRSKLLTIWKQLSNNVEINLKPNIIIKKKESAVIDCLKYLGALRLLNTKTLDLLEEFDFIKREDDALTVKVNFENIALRKGVMKTGHAKLTFYILNDSGILQSYYVTFGAYQSNQKLKIFIIRIIPCD